MLDWAGRFVEVAWYVVLVYLNPYLSPLQWVDRHVEPHEVPLFVVGDRPEGEALIREQKRVPAVE